MLVIGLNQTIDRTVQLPALTPGHVLRATAVAVTPGGKAVNVCRAALTLEAPARLVGLFPGRLGGFAVDLLLTEGIDVIPVEVNGELRGTTVVIEGSGRSTVVNEPGPRLDADGWQRLLDAVDVALRPGAVVAISGSSPPGAPSDAVATLVRLVHAHGGTVAVDVAGAALLLAAEAGADVVSPNLAEAEAAIAGQTVGELVDTGAADAVSDAGRDVLVRAGAVAEALMEAGAGAAVVSAGRHGAVFRSTALQGVDEGVVAAPEVAVVNPIGAGDALLGATLVALEQGRSLPDAVRRGVAYAAASVAHPTAGYADPAVVGRLAETVDRVPT